MKKLLVTAATIGALIAVPAMACPKDGKPGGRMKQHLVSKLELTEEQQTQLDGIFEANQPKRDAIREQMEALREETQTQIKSILSAEQLEEYEAMQERREKRHSKFSKSQM